MTIQMIIDRNNVSKVSDSLQYFTTLVTFVWKEIYFVKYKKTFLEIEDVLSASIFYGYSSHHFKLLKDKIGSGHAGGTTFRVLTVAAVGFWGLPPFLDPQKYKTLPIPGWFPYNATEYYYPTFAFQILAVANTAYTNSTLDILSWVLMSIASGQLEMLKETLKSMNYEEADLKTAEEQL